MKKLYISDLDQTLLDENAQLSEKQKERLNELIRKGVLFTVASARSVKSMQQILEGVDFKLPVIEFNGAFISDFHTGEHLVINDLDKNVISTILKMSKELEILPCFSLFDTDDKLFFPPITNDGLQWYLVDRVNAKDPRLMEGKYLFSEKSEDNVVCLTFINTKAVLEPFYNKIAQAPFAKDLSVYFFENRYSLGWYWLTIQSHKSQKHNAIKELMKFNKLNEKELVVFGDHLNDFSMFKMADRSYAVSNGVQKLKDAATGVIGHHIDGAVVDFIFNEEKN